MMNSDSHDSKIVNHSAEDRFAILWTDYLEGELDAGGMAELDLLFAADERLVARAADLYQTHRRLGLLATTHGHQGLSAAEAFLGDVMKKLPVDGETLTSGVMARLSAAARQQDPPGRRPSWRQRAAVLLVAGGLLATALFLVISNRPRSEVKPSVANDVASGQPKGSQPVAKHAIEGAVAPVRFVSIASARFLGRDTPPRQAEVAVEQTYVLSSGLVEIAFPRGATAILEGPAVFRVCDGDCLAIDSGRCSVHAPEGAEGFRVETPATQVVDRGTRFVVSVDETADTEVQVIEGAADLIAKQATASPPLALATGDVARVDATQGGGGVTLTRVDASQGEYQRQLPDRVIAYTASLRYPVSASDVSLSEDPGIDTLEGVTIQRGGSVKTYSTDELIGVRLLHFRGGKNKNNVTTPGSGEWNADRIAGAEARRSLLETDRLLNTGLINPGGSRTPLSADQMSIPGDEATAPPGLAVRFATPVVNDAGPDVVFFELQMLSDPPEGDAFHVSPLRHNAGLRSHTRTVYDIDSTSPESQTLARFRLYHSELVADSLEDLLTARTNSGSLLPVRAKANCVGIDLSDLGFAPGASCDGLLFQDADDDGATVDPTFIAGLPPLERPGASAAEPAE